MLSNCWLLSDLDGTLISTPHKAKGKYLSISTSPCFEPIKRWLLNGGNVCVVTTADMRVVEQLYFPLQQFLPKSSSDSCKKCGALLLSLYTGAVLYHCTGDKIEMVPNYIHRFHRATEESTMQCKKHNISQPMVEFKDQPCSGLPPSFCVQEAVKGTCISGKTGEAVRALVSQIYLEYTYAILTGKPNVLAAIQKLSRRYKNMWTEVFRFLDQVYAIFKGVNVSTDTSNPFQPDKYRPSSFPVIEWKMRFLRTRPALLRCLGILRIEFAENIAYSKDTPLHGSEKKAVRQIVASLLDSLPELHSDKLRPVAENFAAKMASLLGIEDTELDRAIHLSDHLSKSATGVENIAQMILVGFPLSLYSSFFLNHVPDLVQAGVHCIPQPNSVVFSKLGVSKSTALRYLLGKGLDTRSVTVSQVKQGQHPTMDFAGVVSTANAIALGDNPQSSDFELTVFPDVFFISLEKSSQREERRERIHRRLSRTAGRERLHLRNLMPDGRPAPSLASLQQSLRLSGPMMDDRLWQNLLYIGNEEDGTAQFLNTFMNRLGVPETAKTSSLSSLQKDGAESLPFRAALLDTISELSPISAKNCAAKL